MAEKSNGPLAPIIITVVTIAMLSYGIWYLYKAEILWVLKWLCVVESYIIDIFVNDTKLVAIREGLLAADKESLEWSSMMAPSLRLVGSYMKYPFIILLGIMAYKSMMNPPKKMLRDKMNLDDMIKFQAKSWPYVAPFIDYNPGAESSRRDGGTVPRGLVPFAESLSPEEWVSFHEIEIDKESYEFDEDKAKKVFKSQMGKRWRGTATLPDYQRALFAAFALKGSRKRNESDAMLGEICRCWSRKKGFVLDKKMQKKVSDILKDPKMGHEAVKIANNHAYVTTAMLAVLEWARKQGGVLAPAQFVWLRGQDRNLWYALNSLGRRTCFSEGSGAMAHFYIEKGVKKPLLAKNVDSAINAMKGYFDEHYPEIPEKEKPL